MTEPAQRRSLGAILLESGRITQADVDRALAHQRVHGGFFGQALVSLGILSREETDWALANHFDLPFIFPNAAAVDRDAAYLVRADWALAHMAVPIVRAGRVITVVVTEPLTRDVIDELQARTGYQVEMALASAARIRELIHVVYDTGATLSAQPEHPVSVDEFVGRALGHGTDRFGVSIRGTAALGWWHARNDIERVHLADGWEAALDAMIDPSPLEQLRRAQDGQVRWEALLERGGTKLALEAQALPGIGGAELLFRPLQNVALAPAAAEILLPPTLVTELRLLWRSGAARVAVVAERIEAARALLPLLPSLVVGEQVRAAHVNDTGEAGSAYTLRALPDDSFAELIAGYDLDAITIDLPVDGYPVRGLLRAAPLALVLLPNAETAVPAAWDVKWLLTITGEPGAFVWHLRALHR